MTVKGKNVFYPAFRPAPVANGGFGLARAGTVK